MRNIVYAARRREFESIYHKIETPPLSLCSNSHRSFFQFGFTQSNGAKITENIAYNRTLVWGHPELIDILRSGATDIYIDGTYDAAPHGFKQCVIIMAFDGRTDLFTPIWWCLTQDKSETTYESLLFHCFQSTGHKWVINTLTGDFETAYDTAAKKIFGKNLIFIGCYFHWKDAIRRHMTKKMKMAEKSVSYAMKTGVVDLLTVIPISEILTKGCILPRCFHLSEHFSAQGFPTSRRNW